jgi:hypothetical protein
VIKLTYIKNNILKNQQIVTDTASFTKQQLTTTIAGYSGTEVTYTPHVNASKVVYEVNLTIAWDPDTYGSYPSTRLQYSDDNGSSWNTISGTELLEGTYSPTEADSDWLNMNYSFVLDTWSGSRKIRLAGRAYFNGAEYTIGRQIYASASEGAAACPHITIYSVVS